MIAPLLRSGAVALRPLSLDDAAAMFVAHGDPRVHHFWSGPAFASVEETRAKIADWLAHDNIETWAITRNAAQEARGEALGRITLMHHREGVGEIGILLRYDAQGRGLASMALALVEDYAFNTQGLHKLSADTDPDNVGCLHLFERAGYAREGLLRGNWKTHLGVRDSIILGKLRSDLKDKA
jgi:RimJ/RimL family protein N-acetyltransferase